MPGLGLGQLVVLAGWAAVCVLLTWVSRRQSRRQAWWRLVTWLALGVLVVVNAAALSGGSGWRSWLSLGLLALAVAVMLTAAVTLLTQGEPEQVGCWQRPTVLVSDGIWGIVRHPMYLGLVLVGWGVLACDPSLVGALVAVVASVGGYQMCLADEAECLARWGDEYAAYMARTRRLVPYLL